MNIQESLNSSKESAHHYDAMLQAFAAVAERSTLELGVTLNVKGLIITGFIISQENYFNALIEGLESIDQDNDLKESLQDFLAQLKDKMVGGSAKGKQTLPKFIHLRNVKIYPSEGKGMPTYGDALWRGKIDAVDGFSLGEMVPAKFENVTPPI